MTWTMDIVA